MTKDSDGVQYSELYPLYCGGATDQVLGRYLKPKWSRRNQTRLGVHVRITLDYWGVYGYELFDKE